MINSKKALFLFLLFYCGFFFVSGVYHLILLAAIIAVLGKDYICKSGKISVWQCGLNAVGGAVVYVATKFLVRTLSVPGGYTAADFDFNALFFIKALILVPVAEELLFRGCLADVFAGFILRFFVPLSTILFASVHLYQGLGGVIFAAVCGAALSFTYKMKKNIIFSVIMHSFINLGGCLDCIFFD